jgi:anhydro-N-acetylmuramic acid kinase
MRVAGLMSGTSFDAIDAVVAEIDGDEEITLAPLGWVSAPYEPSLREQIANARTVEDVCRLDARIGQAFAEVAAGLGPVDLIASHGQTLFHWVEDGTVKGTLQVGNPAWIAERTNTPVVSDFRSRDVAAGGQGAPLVSRLDTLLLAGRPGTPAALNLGGIANLTVKDLAFDVGPANALLDAAAQHFTGEPYDRDGALAARGTVIEPLLARLLQDPYYARPAPKSTGKEHFNLAYLGELPDRAEDVLATLTELTARTVNDAAQRYGVTELIVSGGGVRNPTLMRALAPRVTTSDALGLPAQAKEAYAFALLGYLTAQGRPGTLATCTGARHASVLGTLTPRGAEARAPRRLRLVGSTETR